MTMKCAAHRACSYLHFLVGFLAIGFCSQLWAQTEASDRRPLQMASLRQAQKLFWQRVSPTAEQPDGPVLYQLLFSGTGTPGTVPAFDSNPRHLTNSPITVNGNNITITGTATVGGFQLSTGAGAGKVLTSDGAGVGTWQPVGAAGVNITANSGLTATPNPITGTGTIGIANAGVTTAMMGDGSVTVAKLNSGAATNGQVLAANGSGGASWQTLNPALTNAWGLGGNIGIACTVSPCSTFFGTTDTSNIEFRVSNNRALRIEPATDTNSGLNAGFSPNVIEGFSGNRVTGAGVAGATISGGGANNGTDYSNTVSGSFGTIGGGIQNTATGGAYATVAGGYNNTANGNYAIVAGGYGNTAGGAGAVGGGYQNTASGLYSAVGGGSGNSANTSYSTVSGGVQNTASGQESVVAGGQMNLASGQFSTVGGGVANTASGYGSFAAGIHANSNNHTGSFVWGDHASAGVDLMSTADNQFAVRATGGFSFVAGLNGSNNPDPNKTVSIAPNSGIITFAAGQTFPEWNLIGNAGTGCAASPCSTFFGTTDSSNVEFRVSNNRALRIEPATDGSTLNAGFSPNVIGGFSGNRVIGAGVAGAAIGGGGATLGLANTVTASFGTVAGGLGNTASGVASTVAGGSVNNASGDYNTVGGGRNNNAQLSTLTTIAGGWNNKTTALSATVGGGEYNTASGFYSTVAGGDYGTASGVSSFVAGGDNNTASGNNSFAAGQYAKAQNNNSFAWCDGSPGTAGCQTVRDRDFVVVSTGSFRVYANPGYVEMNGGTQTCTLTGSSGGWSCSSDRNLKENFHAIDGRDVLRRVVQMPITRWTFKNIDPTIHHLGPTAQDFYAAFGLGTDDKSIGSTDAQGVALAAIQGLNQKLEEELRQKDAQIAAQQRQIEALRQQMRETMTRLEVVEKTKAAEPTLSQIAASR